MVEVDTRGHVAAIPNELGLAFDEGEFYYGFAKNIGDLNGCFGGDLGQLEGEVGLGGSRNWVGVGFKGFDRFPLSRYLFPFSW